MKNNNHIQQKIQHYKRRILKSYFPLLPNALLIILCLLLSNCSNCNNQPKNSPSGKPAAGGKPAWTATAFQVKMSVEKQESETKIIFLPYTKTKPQGLSFQEFILVLTELIKQEPNKAYELIRFMGYEEIEKNELLAGFKLEATVEQGKSFKIIIHNKTTSKVLQGPFMEGPYNTQHGFKAYLDKNENGEKKEAISFRKETQFDKVLIIPRGPYLTFYHFAKDASEKEIIGFLENFLEDIDRLGPQNITKLVSNAGVGQGIGHFHLHVQAKTTEEVKKIIQDNYNHMSS